MSLSPASTSVWNSAKLRPAINVGGVEAGPGSSSVHRVDGAPGPLPVSEAILQGLNHYSRSEGGICEYARIRKLAVQPARPSPGGFSFSGAPMTELLSPKLVRRQYGELPPHEYWRPDCNAMHQIAVGYRMLISGLPIFSEILRITKSYRYCVGAFHICKDNFNFHRSR